MPVTDNHMPIPDSRAINLYVSGGIQHMDGQQALAYARARHTSSDFDRAQRQQRVILSLRQQTDLASLLNFDRLQQLATDLKSAVRTDIPGDLFPQLVGLGERLDLGNLRSLVFTPPPYAVECNNPAAVLLLLAHGEGPPRSARRSARLQHPSAARRVAAGSQAEGATVEVLNGSGSAGQAATVAAWLQYQGMDAEVSTINGGRADRPRPRADGDHRLQRRGGRAGRDDQGAADPVRGHHRHQGRPGHQHRQVHPDHDRYGHAQVHRPPVALSRRGRPGRQ